MQTCIEVRKCCFYVSYNLDMHFCSSIYLKTTVFAQLEFDMRYVRYCKAVPSFSFVSF